MRRTPYLIDRAVRQLRKATGRGDLDAALRWLIIAERQLDLIDRLGAVARDRTVRRFHSNIREALKQALDGAPERDV